MSYANNIPTLSVGSVVKELSDLYTNVINSGLPFQMIPAQFLWGPPGVGKSDGVMQIAENIRKNTGKKVHVTDIRLLLFSPIDLRGVPVADSNKEFTKWLKPQIFNLDASEEVVNILFLDELSAAPQSIQATAYQITLNRAVGEHKIPDNTIIMAAGNRTTDRSVAYRMPNALANRMMHFDVAVDFDSWRTWAVNNGIHPFVLGYLSFDNSKLCCEKVELDEVAFTSPRSWMFVSNILNTLSEGEDAKNYYTLISACIGSGTALEFLKWCKILKEVPKVEEIFDGTSFVYPSSHDVLHALVCSMTTHAISKEKNGGGISLTELENMCLYAKQFPADYAACLYQNLCDVEQLRMKLLNVSPFKDWMRKNGSK